MVEVSRGRRGLWNSGTKAKRKPAGWGPLFERTREETTCPTKAEGGQRLGARKAFRRGVSNHGITTAVRDSKAKEERRRASSAVRTELNTSIETVAVAEDLLSYCVRCPFLHHSSHAG